MNGDVWRGRMVMHSAGDMWGGGGRKRETGKPQNIQRGCPAAAPTDETVRDLHKKCTTDCEC